LNRLPKKTKPAGRINNMKKYHLPDRL